MQSPKNFYPPEWFNDSQMKEPKAKSAPVNEKQRHLPTQYTTRRLPSGCLLIELAPRLVLNYQERLVK